MFNVAKRKTYENKRYIEVFMEQAPLHELKFINYPSTSTEEEWRTSHHARSKIRTGWKHVEPKEAHEEMN